MDMERADELVEILRHLSPRSLAASRCVCTAWRAVIDDHRLLRADLLPLSLDAVIYETSEPDAPRLFCRRSRACSMTSRVDYLDVESPVTKECSWPMLDYCNGLLLLDDHIIVNPATRQWAKLPPLPPPCTVAGCRSCNSDRYLVYDPTVSPEYNVLLIPRIPRPNTNHTYCYEMVSTLEWPPSPLIINVFSSKTRRWMKRSYIREGDAAGMVADLNAPTRISETYMYCSAYWHEAVYVCCQHAFLMRMNLSNEKYQVIKLPQGNSGVPRLGKSKNGVYCALLHRRCICEVWFLDESHGHMVWVLKNRVNLESANTKCLVVDEPWILQSYDEMERLLKTDVNLNIIDDNTEALVKDDFEWNSETENVVSTADWPREYCDYNAPFFRCLGFHPYKEIILFHDGSSTTVAYYINSSKVQYLGKMELWYEEMEASFAYAPCWRRDLPGSN